MGGGGNEFVFLDTLMIGLCLRLLFNKGEDVVIFPFEDLLIRLEIGISRREIGTGHRTRLRRVVKPSLVNLSR